jgi:hypothetical protein
MTNKEKLVMLKKRETKKKEEFQNGNAVNLEDMERKNAMPNVMMGPNVKEQF